MALTRKFLAALGIDADKIDEIITAHTESTEALKAQIAEGKANSDKLTNVQAELDKVKKDLETANETIKAAEKDNYKGKYESEKAAHDKLKEEIQIKATVDKKSAAFKAMLKEKGYSENAINKITKYGGYVDSVELDDEGKMKDVDKLFENIKSEWGEYTPIEGMDNHIPPTPHAADNSGAPKKSRAAEIAEKYHNNLYGANPTKEG